MRTGKALTASDIPADAVARFWSKVDRGEGCWNWTAGTTEHGYGSFALHAQLKRKAPRVAYALAYGSVPADMLVCHHCDNRLCVRPDHLFLGSQLDNMADMVAKGRKPRGERGPTARYTEAQILRVRQMAAEGTPTKEIAAAFGMSVSYVRGIVTRIKWAHDAVAS